MKILQRLKAPFHELYFWFMGVRRNYFMNPNKKAANAAWMVDKIIRPIEAEKARRAEKQPSKRFRKRM